MYKITVKVDELHEIVNDIKKDDAKYVTLAFIAPDYEHETPAMLEFSVPRNLDSCDSIGYDGIEAVCIS